MSWGLGEYVGCAEPELGRHGWGGSEDMPKARSPASLTDFGLSDLHKNRCHRRRTMQRSHILWSSAELALNFRPKSELCEAKPSHMFGHTLRLLFLPPLIDLLRVSYSSPPHVPKKTAQLCSTADSLAAAAPARRRRICGRSSMPASRQCPSRASRSGPSRSTRSRQGPPRRPRCASRGSNEPLRAQYLVCQHLHQAICI